jgi:hypothetical protein
LLSASQRDCPVKTAWLLCWTSDTGRWTATTKQRDWAPSKSAIILWQSKWSIQLTRPAIKQSTTSRWKYDACSFDFYREQEIDKSCKVEGCRTETWFLITCCGVQRLLASRTFQFDLGPQDQTFHTENVTTSCAWFLDVRTGEDPDKWRTVHIVVIERRKWIINNHLFRSPYFLIVVFRWKQIPSDIRRYQLLQLNFCENSNN